MEGIIKMKSSLSCIITTCGTSIMTNAVSGEDKTLVYKHANVINKKELDKNVRKRLESIISKADEMIKTATISDARKMSAELNALLAFYDEKPPRRNDVHILIGTSTLLGETTVKFLEDWLKNFDKNLIIIPHIQEGLQTADFLSFHDALLNIAKFLEKHLPEYKKSGYRIVFNPTGGFKAVLSFLQSIAPLYADESIYLFETSKELLRIPALPMVLDDASVRENLTALRRLKLGLSVKNQELDTIPDSLLFRLDQDVTLSAWGESFVSRCLDSLYRQALQPEPSEKIRFSKKFHEDVKLLAPDRLYQINRQIDRLACFLEKGENPKALFFKKLVGDPSPPATHEFYAWSDQDAKRIFGRFQRDTFEILFLKKHL